MSGSKGPVSERVKEIVEGIGPEALAEYLRLLDEYNDLTGRLDDAWNAMTFDEQSQVRRTVEPHWSETETDE